MTRTFDLLVPNQALYQAELCGENIRMDATLHLWVESPSYNVTVLGDFPWSD
ncbi:hypothetical protein PP427_gp176 [Salmonella phage KM16]|uniref:hypothetical protein n=1 Tax=Salmonella phage KM16 TaxID=2797303 RepID=UPI0024916193|nr:hypothetical protein PP427_gp176 [Salmonella phage KM16]